MPHRIISGLRWARPIPRPSCIPVGRPSGAKAQGIRYEKALAEALPEAIHGQWFEFEDSNGLGYCQPDFLISRLPKSLWILECKYTWTVQGHTQLEQLYIPVVQEAIRVPVVGIVVTKVLRPYMPGVEYVANGLNGAWPGDSKTRMVWHWLGKAAPISFGEAA